MDTSLFEGTQVYDITRKYYEVSTGAVFALVSGLISFTLGAARQRCAPPQVPLNARYPNTS